MGNWDCESIYDVATYYLSVYDENYDGVISSEDDIDAVHLALLVESCDINGNAEVDACETHACIVNIENSWR